MKHLLNLITRWRDQAEDCENRGFESQAQTWRSFAAELQKTLHSLLDEPLTLEEASLESGYSKAHLGRLVSDGTVPNAGELYSPRIRRRDLPRKPGNFRTLEEDISVSNGALIGSRKQAARSVANSS